MFGKQEKYQSVSPQTIKIKNVSEEIFEELNIIENSEFEINNDSNKSLKKANEENYFPTQIDQGNGWYLNFEILLKMCKYPEIKDLLRNLNQHVYQKTDKRLTIEETRELVKCKCQKNMTFQQLKIYLSR